MGDQRPGPLARRPTRAAAGRGVGGFGPGSARLRRTAEAAFGRDGSTVGLAGLDRDWLSPEGILSAPFVAADGGASIAIFLYLDADPASAARFIRARERLRSRGEPDPVYYATAPLPDVEPGNALVPFDLGRLNRAPDDPTQAGHHAIWWTRDLPADVEGLAGLDAIQRSYRALDRIETYAFAHLLRQFGLAVGRPSRADLPEEPALIPVRGPEGVPLLISASAAKGIRIHFGVDATAESYRDAFWANWAGYFEAFRVGLLENGLALDLEADESPMEWWGLNEAFLRGQPAGSACELGVIPA